jgi:F-type H+-transporting ATPase subunit delta
VQGPPVEAVPDACYARAQLGGLHAHCAGALFSQPFGRRPRALTPPSCAGRELSAVTTDEPMMASMAGRYAAALFELAKEDKQLKQVEGDLADFQRMLDTSNELRRLVRSPVISADDQAKAVAAVLAKAGASGLTGNFLRLIARNRRLFAVSDMIKVFRALAARERGEVSADVASAHPLTPEQMKLLTDTLRISVGKEVQVNTRVDPNLLGGLVVKIGSKMIDSSLRTKLDNLKVAMKGTS